MTEPAAALVKIIHRPRLPLAALLALRRLIANCLSSTDSGKPEGEHNAAPSRRSLALDTRRTDAHVIQLALMGTQAGLYIAQAFSMGELCECYDKILVEAMEPFYIPFALILSNASAKGVHGQVVH